MEISCFGKSDIGFQRDINEDYIFIKNLTPEITVVILADGSGSKGTTYQPASIASVEIYKTIERLFSKNPDYVLSNAEAVLESAMLSAGRVLSAFRIANEELYGGYAVSCECGLFYGDRFSYAHTGNTRIHLLRMNKQKELSMKLLTKDQTEGQKLVDEGKMDPIQYHLSMERLKITGGLGAITDPEIDTFTLTLKPDDFIFITTDGIHYAIRPEIMVEILKRSQTLGDCVDGLITAAKQEEYNDNMSGILCWAVMENKGNGGEQNERKMPAVR